MIQKSTRSRLVLMMGLAVPLGGLTATAQEPYRISLLNAPAPLEDPAPYAETSVLEGPEAEIADAPALESADLESADLESAASEPVAIESTAIESPTAQLSVLDRQTARPIGEAVGPVEVVQERYPDGKVKIRREMTLDAVGNYILHGEWKMWDTHGTEVASGTYENGQRHGTWTRQLAARDAELLTTRPYSEYQAPFTSQATFKEGQLHGKWVIFDSQKRVVSELEFVDGQREGLATWNYPSGKKMKQIDYRKGTIDGRFIAWDPAGKVIVDDIYQAGRKLAPKVTSSSGGQKKSEGLYLFAKQIVQSPDDWWNSKMATYSTVGQDDRHGRWVSWYPNGQKEYEGTYENNQPSGLFTWWYPNSQVRVSGSYKDGKAHGEWSWWFENGQKSEHGQYEDGEPTGSWAYWKPNGLLHHKSDFDSQQGVVSIDADAEDSAEAPEERTSFKGAREFPENSKL